MKVMKKEITACLIILLIVALSFSMASCGAKEPSPKEVLDGYLKQIQTEGLQDADIDLGELGEDGDAEFIKSMLDKVKDFEYELSNEIIEGDEATVDIKVKTYGFGAMLTEVFSEYIQQAFIMAFSDATEEEMTTLFENLFTEKLNVLEKNYEKTLTVEMVKGEEGWEFKDKSGENPLLDALLGGLYTSIENLGTAFDE